MIRSIADDIAVIAGIEAVPSILEVACRVTGLRFAAIARVTETSWTACAVRDEIAFGLEPGGELDVATTLCDEIRASGSAVVIDHVAADPVYNAHRTPSMYGFQSYISMPIVRRNGEFFGTLCALDPKPAKLSDPTVVATFRLFAELVAMHLDSSERLVTSEAALLDANRTAELREQFIAVLGHDLRNPLASIAAGARLLADRQPDRKAARIVALMQESCRRMAGLIDDVLDLARGRLGDGLPLRSAPAALGASLGQVVAELRAVHPGRMIQAEIALPDPIVCDQARIAQLLSNLLGNALTHGDRRRPVRVAAACRDGRFTLDVVNHGPPIPSGRLAMLFQPFTRGGEGTPREGLGLGLYIAAEIARAHGGKLTVASTEAETRFTLIMPAGSAEVSQPESEASDPRAPAEQSLT